MAAAPWLLSKHSHQNETTATNTMEGDYLTTSALHSMDCFTCGRIWYLYAFVFCYSRNLKDSHR